MDTNVLLSESSSAASLAASIAAWQNDHLEIVLSPAILAEYYESGADLALRYGAIDTPLASILALVTQPATIIDAPDLPGQVSTDPADDKLLACAIAAHVPLIITGDTHLLRVNGWGGITIVTPRQFVDRYLDGEQRAQE
ncbi:MAG: putative toxin-antitoxin system toxin component, PIN family [Gemmatimonadaceae bacterium]